MNFPEEWNHLPYLKNQLFNYLGNKRRLLSFIYKVVQETALIPSQTTFVDLFAGSGAVARLAKKMGFHSIVTNDWEPYSYITQRLYIKESLQSLQTAFQSRGGIEHVLDELNALTTLPIASEAYISRYYAPKNLEKFDSKKERLFYTPQNAIKIDAIRSTIEKWYPKDTDLTQEQQREKDILIALLLYEASVHTNTGGVFKAYYKEFGGYGHHALNRILSPIHLSYPVLGEEQPKVHLYQQDANVLAGELKYETPFSLVYLDPPYNVHQYGSNYHLLNTIALWDKPPLDGAYEENGNLKRKAGIRADWQNTRSTFCSPLLAKDSFQSLIESISADIIMVSYSTDGLIPFEDMANILSSKGELHIAFNPYIKYRGGKKSLTRVNHNVEFILWVDTRKRPSVKKMQQVLSSLRDTQNQMDMFGVYDLHKGFRKYFAVDKKVTGQFYWKKHADVSLRLNSWGEFLECQGLENLKEKEKEEFRDILSYSRCRDKKEELEVFLNILDTCSTPKETLALFQKIRNTLQFLAHPKNREDFLRLFAKGKKALDDSDLPIDHPFRKKWLELLELFQKRDSDEKR